MSTIGKAALTKAQIAMLAVGAVLGLGAAGTMAWQLAEPTTANLYIFCHGSPQTIGYDPLNQRGLGRCGLFSSEIGVLGKAARETRRSLR